MNGMNIRGLPGMFAPMYQEFAEVNSVADARREHSSIHPSTASTLGSMVVRSFASRCAIASAIQSTCCSAARIMLVRTLGLPGPVTTNRFGKPLIPSPR